MGGRHLRQPGRRWGGRGGGRVNQTKPSISKRMGNKTEGKCATGQTQVFIGNSHLSEDFFCPFLEPMGCYFYKGLQTKTMKTRRFYDSTTNLLHFLLCWYILRLWNVQRQGHFGIFGVYVAGRISERIILHYKDTCEHIKTWEY